jgi:hypothetical protein
MMDKQEDVAPGGKNGIITGSSIQKPARPGFTVKTTIERGNAYEMPEIYDLELTVLEIQRGQPVFGKSNTALDPLYEYISVRLRAGYFRRGRQPGGEVYNLGKNQFAIVAGDGETEYEIPAIFGEGQFIYGPLSPGELREGWVVLQVPKQEDRPVLIFKRPNPRGVYEIWGNIWFRLY